jgi:DNA-directed RNA polymerase subunit L
MENLKTSLNGYRIDFELNKVPIPLVNGLRRILLAEIPTVVIRDVVIRANTTQLNHEMLKHRVLMLPVNVQVSEVGVIRDTKLRLHFDPSPEVDRVVTSDDFVISGSTRKDVLLKDRDLGTPMLFLKLNVGGKHPEDGLQVDATLGVDESGASQVCVATFKNHIDPERAKLDRDTYLLGEGAAATKDPRIFDNHLIQRSFERDEHGRPTRFDFAIESIGVVPARDLLRQAVEVYQRKVTEFLKEPISKTDDGMFAVESVTEGHTLGALAQVLILDSGLVDFVSYDPGHPLVPKLTLRFRTKVKAETVLERFRTDAMALFESILKGV